MGWQGGGGWWGGVDVGAAVVACLRLTKQGVTSVTRLLAADVLWLLVTCLSFPHKVWTDLPEGCFRVHGKGVGDHNGRLQAQRGQKCSLILQNEGAEHPEDLDITYSSRALKTVQTFHTFRTSQTSPLLNATTMVPRPPKPPWFRS